MGSRPRAVAEWAPRLPLPGTRLLHPQKFLKPYLRDRYVGEFKTVDVFRMRCAFQATVQIIRPGMIRADDLTFVTTAAKQPVATMAAHIIKCPHLIILATQNKYILAEHRKAVIITRVSNLAGVARQLPAVEKNR